MQNVRSCPYPSPFRNSLTRTGERLVELNVLFNAVQLGVGTAVNNFFQLASRFFGLFFKIWQQ